MLSSTATAVHCCMPLLGLVVAVKQATSQMNVMLSAEELHAARNGKHALQHQHQLCAWILIAFLHTGFWTCLLYRLKKGCMLQNRLKKGSNGAPGCLH